MTQNKTKTESHNPNFTGMDEWNGQKLVTELLQVQADSLQAIILDQNALEQLSKAVSAAAHVLAQTDTGRLIYGGAGTSIRLGVLDGVELTPTYSWPSSRVAFAIAGGQEALIRSVENAEDNKKAARKTITGLDVGLNDVFIGVAASGNTPYTVAACEEAQRLGATTIGIANNDHSKLLRAAEYPIFLNSKVEPVAGSTRMNAGTTQTVALKTLSTGIMTRLGKVYDGYMVDMQQTNEKLRKRAVKMVTDVSGCTETVAEQALDKSNGWVKLAVLVSKGVDPDEGRRLLGENCGFLRPAIKNLG